LRVFLEAVDPNLASKLIMPANEATTKEIIETSHAAADAQPPFTLLL